MTVLVHEELNGMGKHAFTEDPEHCLAYRRITVDPLPRIYGLGEARDMPVVRHRSILGEGADFAGVSHYVLTYHISGSPVQRADRKESTQLARTGSISLQLPGSGGSFRSLGNGAVEYAHLYFQQSLLDAALETVSVTSQKQPKEDFFGLVDITWQRDIMTYLERAKDTLCPPTTLEMDARAIVLIQGLLRVVEGTALQNTAVLQAGLKEREVSKIKQYLLSRLNEKIRLNDMAEIAGFSPYHFARKFKATTGETPNAYLMRIRLSQAVKLLRETQMPISEIAFQVGFSSQSHLTRRLKEEYGLPPAKLRNAEH